MKKESMNRMYDHGYARDLGRNRAKKASLWRMRMHHVEPMLPKAAHQGAEGHQVTERTKLAHHLHHFDWNTLFSQAFKPRTRPAHRHDFMSLLLKRLDLIQ